MFRHASGILYSLCLIFTSVIFAQPSTAAEENHTIQFPVEKFQLKNGLTVLVHEDRSLPLMSYQQWFRVGSAHEKAGRTGFAHFFEHLVFKGTQKYPAAVYENLVQKNGGSNNAFTTRDHTGYYTHIPSDKLELLVDIESDRMRNLLFDQKEINSEREVVKEERRMRYENSVFGSLYLELMNTVFKTSPYSWPTIGSMKDLNAAQMSEFKEFYDQYYVPNNAVIVVAGDVSVSQVKKLMEKHYGSMPSRDLPKYEPAPEAEQRAARYSKIYKDVQAETIGIAYPTVSVHADDTYALDFLAMALGGGDSSRLHKTIVYKRALATGVSAGHSSMQLNGVFSVSITMRPGKSSSSSIQLTMSEIKKMQSEMISEDELVKLRNTLKMAYVSGLQTVASRSEQLADAEITYGDYRKLFTNIDKYNSVTREDIQRVAQKYLLPEKRSLVVVMPKPSEKTEALLNDESANGVTEKGVNKIAQSETKEAQEVKTQETNKEEVQQ